jgi:hypothetical protein
MYVVLIEANICPKLFGPICRIDPLERAVLLMAGTTSFILRDNSGFSLGLF